MNRVLRRLHGNRHEEESYGAMMDSFRCAASHAMVWAETVNLAYVVQ